MARKPKTPPPPLTREQKIAEALEKFRNWKEVDPRFIGTPTRTFEVGDACQVGNLSNCVVVQKLYDGKAYVIEYDRTEREGTFHCIDAWWWSSVEKTPRVNQVRENEHFREYRRGQVSACDISSLLGMYHGTGLACNPEYQRGYVWTDYDRTQLLESIFDRLEIGSTTFVRNQGYRYGEDATPMRYISLTGEEVFVPKNKNHLTEIIDGQQRVTTIIRYLLDMFPFKGKRFSELSFRDQIDFEGFSISYRIINAEDITRKELLEMFLQVNRGVPQSPDHLELVRKLYEAEA